VEVTFDAELALFASLAEALLDALALFEALLVALRLADELSVAEAFRCALAC